MSRRLTLLLFLIIFSLSGCDLLPETAPAPEPGPDSAESAPTLHPDKLVEIPLQVGYSYRGPFYEIYFTDPFSPEAKTIEGGLDVPLAQAIESARLSVDVAAYSLSLGSIRNALLNASERGVRVRLIMESGNMDRPVPQTLIAAGIPIKGDFMDGLMHNKFVVIDRAEVWTGSMNLTTNGVYEDNNNLVRIYSPQLAENYTVEFNEMFEKGFFGPNAVAKTPNPQLTIDGIDIETYFSPDDGVAQRLAELLRNAQSSIYFLAYSFTADDFGEILLDKQLDGLKIAGIMEEEQVRSNQGTEYDPFKEAGLSVYIDGNSGQMHHKVFIIDQQIVVLGSYNFSASAEQRNDENVLIIHDPRVAELYHDEFQRVVNASQK